MTGTPLVAAAVLTAHKNTTTKTKIKTTKNDTKQNIQDNHNNDHRDNKKMRRQTSLLEFHFKTNYSAEENEKEKKDEALMTKKEKKDRQAFKINKILTGHQRRKMMRGVRFP